MADELSVEKARQLALRRLGAREYSAGAMRTYLKRKGFDDEHVDEVITRLVELKLIDDSRFASMFVREQLRRGKGRRLIKEKLRQKGIQISDTDLRSLVEENSSSSELEMAREIVNRRYPKYGEDKREGLRALRALLSRGFDYETALKAIKGTDIEA
jgi:regulatory protein